MAIGNVIRRIGFWTIDFLKGEGVRKHYREISSILENPFSSKSTKRREEMLTDLLLHSVETVPFYSSFNATALEEFPVVKKSIIQKDLEQFKSSKYRGKKLYKVATSGSTGTPFYLYQNTNKRKRNTADVLYFFSKVGHKLGDRLYELEVWRDHNKKDKIKVWMQNVVRFDVSKLTDSRINFFLQLLNKDKHYKTFLGFSSSYESICQYLDKLDQKLSIKNVRSIIAGSEYLNSYTKIAMGKYFNAPVFSKYSNEELGILAHQTISSGENFKINWASYFIELLDMEKDEPVKKGQMGRIVITDLFNYSMPIIRYDTGDVAKFSMNNGEHLHFEHIEGRKMDLIYDTKGNILSSFVVYTKFHPYYSLLKQYQFIQEGVKCYTIKLNVHDSFPFEQQLVEDVKKDFGEDAKVKIIYVDEIPPLSSGKRKKVLSLLNKK